MVTISWLPNTITFDELRKYVTNKYAEILSKVIPMTPAQNSILSFVNRNDILHRNRLALSIVNAKWRLQAGYVAHEIQSIFLPNFSLDEQALFLQNQLQSDKYKVLYFGLELFQQLELKNIPIPRDIGTALTKSHIPWDISYPEISYAMFIKQGIFDGSVVTEEMFESIKRFANVGSID